MTSYLELDYPLVRACLEGKKYAWEDFVDRFMDLVVHVVEHTAEKRAKNLSEEEKIELCEAIFRSFRYNDYQLLREFAYRSSVSSYLTVLARRLAVAFLSED
jgi:RNA polymerase sigma-70 factor (ECF subfamily)